MGRSEEVRQQALERDGFRCQITGFGRNEEERKLLEVHHWKRLGMGGSDEPDTLDNVITLGPLHRLEIHPSVSVPTKRIVKWEPADQEDGLVVEERVDFDEAGPFTWVPIDKSELWFYRRHDAAALEKEIDLVRQIQLTEPKRAEIMAHIWEHYDLVSDAASPEQFVAGLGLDSTRAKDEAKAARWIKENGLTWPDGVNVRKVLLIASVNAMDALLYRDDIAEQRTAQELLNQAADMSYSDLRKTLIERGLKQATMRWYIVTTSSRWAGLQKILFVRSRNLEAVVARLGRRQALLEINAFRAGIHWDRKAQKLYDAYGTEVGYETWE